ncbi:uroporphyrin-III C-methyltransferase, partial [Spiromyces aspiralis]
IANKRVAVFGTGSVANTRALFALDAGAFVRLITPEIDSERLHSSLRELVKSGKVEHVEATKLSASLIADIAVVFVTDLGEEIAVYDLLKASHSLGIPVNIANRRDLSDFTLMSTYSGATGLQIAVSTNGVADRVATSLLKEIVRKLPDGLEAQLGDIARFNEVAKKAEAARLDAVRSLDARFSDAGAQLKTLSAKDIPASPRSDNGCGDASDLSAAATIAQTPALCCSSAASISDPSETAAAADFR